MKNGKKSKILALLLICALSLSALTGCGGGGSDSAEARTDLNWALASEPNSLDPMAIAMMSTFTVTYAIYDNLVEQDAEGNYVEALAEKWEVSKDEKTYTFKLREDVKFHDGTPMTADDVVYSINRTIEKAGRQI